MLDHDISPMRAMRTNDGMNIRKKANTSRFDSMRPTVSMSTKTYLNSDSDPIVHSPSSFSTKSSSSFTFQNENENDNDNHYQNQQEHKDEHDNGNRRNTLHLDRLQNACDLELPSPATQMSFSYPREQQYQSPSSLIRVRNEDSNNTHTMPFRNRFFASAALVSNQHGQQQKDHHHPNEKGWERFAPPNSAGVLWDSIANRGKGRHHSTEASPNITVEIPSNMMAERKESQAGGQQPTSLSRYISYDSGINANDNNHDDNNNHDSEYESFANQSVFSDLTGSEISEPFPHMSKGQHGDNGAPYKNTRIQNRYASAPQETLLEVDEEQVEGELGREEEKDQQIDSLYRRRIIDIARGRGNRAQYGSKDDVEPDEITGGRAKSMTSRIAQLLSNQNTISNAVGNTQRGEHTVTSNKGASGFADKISHLAPREGAIPMASPTRSNVSRASSSYVGWPGTLDKHGSTLAISSNFSAEGESIKQNNDVEKDGHVGVACSSKIRNGYLIDCHDAKTTPEDGNELIDNKAGKPSGLIVSQTISRSNVGKMKLKYKGDVVDLDDDIISVDYSGIANPPDFYLAAIGVETTSLPQSVGEKKASSPEQFKFLERETNLNQTNPLISHSLMQGRHRNQNFTSTSRQHRSPNHSVINASEAKIEAGRSMEQENAPRSSMEIHCQDCATPTKGSSMKNKETMEVSKVIDTRASLLRIQSAKSARRALYPTHKSTYSRPKEKFVPLSHTQTTPEMQSPKCVHLSENALKENDRLTPAHINVSAFKGYRGYLDKTKDVPNLIDDDIDSVTTAGTHATDTDAFIKRVQQSSADEESDIFDGLPNISGSDVFDGLSQAQNQVSNIHNNTSAICSSASDEVPDQRTVQKDVNRSKGPVTGDIINRLGIQATPKAFREATSLSKSKIDFVGHDADNGIKIQKKELKYSPAEVLENLPEGEGNSYIYDNDSISSESTSEDSWIDLSKYAIDPGQIRKLVRKFRNMSKISEGSGESSSIEDDGKTAFALFEMRSRIMETDIIRGLERTGGTVIVDDIILTPYNQAAHRIRDAIIVSKAWRDGASPKDARTASSLMSSDAVHCIKRVVRSNRNSASSQRSISNESFCGRSALSGKNHYQLYSWEKVLWTDDTEFSLLRCPSLGPRTMRGFEMFTVGDCQSILLKLTNERCEELREALEIAIRRQLFAEQSLKEERDVDDDSDLDRFMTDAETVYLQAMEDVKVTAKNLAHAEKSFNMVREKIENLVKKYEHLLEKIDNDEDSAIRLKSNINTSYDDNCATNEIEDHYAEKEKLKLRAHRAELKAEVAVREAEKSKQEAEIIKYEKQEELETLQKKLEELETKSAHMANEFEMKLNSQKLLVNSIGNGSSSSQISLPLTIDSTLVSATGTQSLLYAASHVGLDQEKINAKVRIKERFRQRNAQKLTGQVHQRLEFYERSLQAVRK